MKILHVPFTFHPDPIGGTEIYVEQLASELLNNNIQTVIAAPGEKNVAYTHNQLKVYRYFVAETHDLREAYGAGNRTAVQNFVEILRQEQPTVVHLHAFTRGVSILMV